MSNYTQTTAFGPKDSLPVGDPNKRIRGAEFDTEFGNISTAIASKVEHTDPTFSGGVVVGNPTGGRKGAGTINTEGLIYQNNDPVATLTGDNVFSGSSRYYGTLVVSANLTLSRALHASRVLFCDTSSDPFTITLPDSGFQDGDVVYIVHHAGDTHRVTLSRQATRTINVDGASSAVTSYTLNVGARGLLFWGAGQWCFISNQPRVLGKPAGGAFAVGTLNVEDYYRRGSVLAPVRAWGHVLADGSLQSSFGISSSSRLFTGIYQVNLSHVMPNANYAVLTSYAQNPTNLIKVVHVWERTVSYVEIRITELNVGYSNNQFSLLIAST